ncbi:unnamed protein product [Moneuplotes crassus]|uniref:mitogen-activated protein kinase kinase n=1 Tax=Euplotes crassus TaxID=5936 RepID=A0AAD1UFI7_EUPCR|nr:unnamed protein product [Moneuplotes crassus]
METDQPMSAAQQPVKKKKKRPMMKLKIPEQHTTPEENVIGVGEEKKVADSIQSTDSYQHVVIDKEQIDIQDEMDKYAPTVHGNTFNLSRDFAEQSVPNTSTADVSMTSNSLCNRIAESSLGSGTMSFEDIQKTVMHIEKNYGNDTEASSTMEEEIASEIDENRSLFDNSEMSIDLSDLKCVGTLGQGASGRVEKCFHKPTKKRIALKVIPVDASTAVKKQLLLELKTLHECESDYIVKSYGAFLKSGNVNIALEYMDAGSLTSVLEVVEKIPEDILGLMTIQMLKGLHYLHKEKKVIHRDIKPSNILLNKKGQVKIADFGVSGKIEKTLDCLSSWVGTMTHMSPERLRGEAYYADTDIWSLGLILLECALGKFPFKIDDEINNEAGFWKILSCIENSEPCELPDGFSEEFRDFIKICLEKTPGSRQSAAELLEHKFCEKYDGMDNSLFKRWIKTTC